jgi:3',5'-cyclic-AMP phosphodiesterase
MKLAWATDVHLDFVGEPGILRFGDGVRAAGAEGLLLTGDIAHAGILEDVLAVLERRLQMPIWFVLGNHDFYGASVAEVRRRATVLSRAGRVVWLGAVDVVALTPHTALVGHDGWGDARFGDHAGSPVLLNDFLRIADLRLADRAELGHALGRLGDESAAHLRRVLPPALERFEHVLVATHVPPFREACLHEGVVAGDEWLPYFACRATGEALREEAARRPDRRLTVLCGHTHCAGECRPLPNLRVVTGGADYGRPALQAPLLEV